MNHSIYLARVMGLYLSILSLALLINLEKLPLIVTILFSNLAMQFTVGMILLLAGTLLVVSHNVWKMSWVVLITILSWLILIKGTLYLIFPDLIQVISHFIIQEKNWICAAGLLNLLIGLYLCYMGFFSSKSSIYS